MVNNPLINVLFLKQGMALRRGTLKLLGPLDTQVYGSVQRVRSAGPAGEKSWIPC